MEFKIYKPIVLLMIILRIANGLDPFTTAAGISIAAMAVFTMLREPFNHYDKDNPMKATTAITMNAVKSHGSNLVYQVDIQSDAR